MIHTLLYETKGGRAVQETRHLICISKLGRRFDMITLSKVLLCIILLVSIARLGSAQPAPEDVGMEQKGIREPGMELVRADDMWIQRTGAPPSGVPVGMLISKQGVARKDNKTYSLRIIVECFMLMEPRRVQKLMASNKSLDEIRDAIRAAHGEPMYHGEHEAGRADLSSHKYPDSIPCRQYQLS